MGRAVSDDVRIFPPVVPVAALTVAGLAHAFVDLPRLPPGSWQPGALLTVLGFALVLWALLAQLRAGTNPDVHKPTTALVVRGPYGFSRNPIYLGFLVVQAGVGLWLGWWLAVVLVPFSGLALSRWVIRGEEAQLARRFPAYEAYRDRVRRWF